LEEHQVRIGGKELRKDITTFHMIIQTSNIPATHLDASIHQEFVPHRTQDSIQGQLSHYLHYLDDIQQRGYMV
jgi:CHAD domain-containing protein